MLDLFAPIAAACDTSIAAGPMGSLLRAMATGGRPYPTARDNLGTIRLADALYTSMDSGHSVSVK